MIKTGKKVIECSECGPKSKGSHSKGVFFAELKTLNEVTHLFLVCRSCKNILWFPVDIKAPFTGKIFHCSRPHFRAYEASKSYVLRCLKCNENIKIPKLEK